MRKWKTFFKGCAIVLGALFLVVIVYIAYLFLSYERIDDMQAITVEAPKEKVATAEKALRVNVEYSAVTYNIGFGAYTPEFSFFMDGGTSSWAESEESVLKTVTEAGTLVAELTPDFALFQEVDLNATRSYHVNQYALLQEMLPEYYSAFAVNYDSAFLAYPFNQPHGKSNSGLVLFSRFPITQSVRRSLPISTTLTKFFDLDRCYSVSRIPVENGKELVILTLHLSAYGNSDEIRKGQIRMLCEEMEKEYEAGNYVICGGDFNHDLKALTDDGEERESWAYPFPRESLPEHFSFCIDGLSEAERTALWDSTRNADMPYTPGETYTVTLDGFIISDNIACVAYETLNTGYRYSDHDPVCMRFCLLH